MCIIQFHLKFAHPVLLDLILNGTFHSQPKCKLHLENQVRRRCIQVNTGKSIWQSAYFRSLLDPPTRQGLRKRCQAGQSEMCASFLAMLPAAFACLFGNFVKRDLHWVIGRARIKSRAGLNCALSDQTSKGLLGFVMFRAPSAGSRCYYN